MFKHTVSSPERINPVFGTLAKMGCFRNFIALLSTMMSIITIIISVALMNSRKLKPATKRNAMERWCGRDCFQAICAVHRKRTSWAHKRPFIVCSNNVTRTTTPFICSCSVRFRFRIAKKEGKEPKKTIQFVFICTFTFHSLLRNFDGFSWSPSKLCYFLSGSVGLCVCVCAYFSVTCSLLVCFSSSSSYVVCMRESWENPNTSRTRKWGGEESAGNEDLLLKL